MEFEAIEGGHDVLTCTDDSIPTDASNLVIKALELFRSKTGSQQRFRVHLTKRVPHGVCVRVCMCWGRGGDECSGVVGIC